MFGERPRPHGKTIGQERGVFFIDKTRKQQCIWGKEQMNEDKNAPFSHLNWGNINQICFYIMTYFRVLITFGVSN